MSSPICEAQTRECYRLLTGFTSALRRDLFYSAVASTKVVMIASSPVAVCLFVVELLRVLCSYRLVDDLGGVVQELQRVQELSEACWDVVKTSREHDDDDGRHRRMENIRG